MTASGTADCTFHQRLVTVHSSEKSPPIVHNEYSNDGRSPFTPRTADCLVLQKINRGYSQNSRLSSTPVAADHSVLQWQLVIPFSRTGDHLLVQRDSRVSITPTTAVITTKFTTHKRNFMSLTGKYQNRFCFVCFYR